MEHGLQSIAEWLGSNALVFFAFSLGAALVLVAGAWYLIVSPGNALFRSAERLWVWFKQQPAMTRIHGPGTRLSRIAGYLTAYALLAFAAALGSIVLLIELADEVRTRQDIAAFDHAFTSTLGTHITRSSLEFFYRATWLGDPVLLTVVSAVVAVLLLWKRKRLLAVIWIVAVGGNGLLTRALKAVFERTRPIHDHGLVAYEGWSFPSGHASASLAVYTMLLYLLLRGRERQWWHLPAVVATAALVLVVGFSRVFLQVHYLSDVVAGYLVAGSWLCVCIAAAEVLRAYGQRLKV